MKALVFSTLLVAAVAGFGSGGSAEPSLEGTHFLWADVGAPKGCGILGAGELNGAIILGGRNKYVVAIGRRKACPSEITVGKAQLRVRRYDAYEVQRLMFKAYRRDAYLLVWRPIPRVYTARARQF